MSHDVWMNAWGDHVIFFLFLYYAIIVDLFQVRNVLTLKHLSDKVLRRNEKNFVIVIIIYIFFHIWTDWHFFHLSILFSLKNSDWTGYWIPTLCNCQLASITQI